MRDRQSKIVNLCYIKLDDREEVRTQYDKKLQAPLPLPKRRPNVEIEIVELDDVEKKKGCDEDDGLESGLPFKRGKKNDGEGLSQARTAKKVASNVVPDDRKTTAQAEVVDLDSDVNA
ncbi:hypothetical protein FOZ63_017988 [Perkinsus olseni]|uniref:Uncharacterized protein n=1 Tax=Perkinsus olseni TaxID=32597 RepID=A0A7J6S2U2_PEROL|nr:hypothetical protein FOZ63_017988 [Perkinsus olseni]